MQSLILADCRYMYLIACPRRLASVCMCVWPSHIRALSILFCLGCTIQTHMHTTQLAYRHPPTPLFSLSPSVFFSFSPLQTTCAPLYTLTARFSCSTRAGSPELSCEPFIFSKYLYKCLDWIYRQTRIYRYICHFLPRNLIRSRLLSSKVQLHEWAMAKSSRKEI